jgi:phosphatidylserine/phosphatidylglycerophosphate/cardiolipin synthase-like enzyme|tara:strand:- start:176 stop:598 length:423 start_codon:yes stop_codon:yes gene_type:complete
MSSVKTTLKNPIVTIWDVAVSETYDSCVGEIHTGMIGSMNLSTASSLYDFENPLILADALVALGKGTRLKVTDEVWAKSGSGIYLEYNPKGTAFHMAEDEAHPENIKYDERGELIEEYEETTEEREVREYDEDCLKGVLF